MLIALIVLVAAVVAWLLIDRLLLQRRQRRVAAWSEFGPERTFHSTGWEETVPPLEASDAPTGRDVPAHGPGPSRA